jgi:DNA-binding MarR family transcriptional regulator
MASLGLSLLCKTNYDARARLDHSPGEVIAMPVTRAPADIDIAAWRGLVRVQGAVRRRVGEALETAEGISLWDYTVLRTLSEASGRCMRMSDLARATDYTPSGLTRLVERLERTGLVRRGPCPDDGRGSVATLTRDGQRTFVRARTIHLASVREHFLAHCTDKELDVLASVWERVLPGATA